MPKSFSDLLEQRSYRWPQRGDRLFASSNDPEADATVATQASTRRHFIADGYKDAADALADQAIEDKVARHGLIFPIIFCYRQHVELSLKHLITEYGHYQGVPVPRRNHDLKELLRTFRKILRGFGIIPDPTGADLAVSRCILELHRIDPHSFHISVCYRQRRTSLPDQYESDRSGSPQRRDGWNPWPL
jgi:hypothetical protein